jgi:sodium-independent sulfate anion transporter 11
VGILSLLLGIFKLGWLLDFISLPVLTGFIMGAALIIIQSQIPTLLGEVAVSPVFIQQGKDIFLKIKTAQPLTFAIGFSGIIMLLIMQFIGKKWGKRNTAAWIVGISKNAIVLILYTGISFGVNKNLEKPLWAVTGEIPSGLQAPKVPEAAFLPILLQLSFPVFIAAALEHISIAKSFGRRNGYTIDQSQELVFLGVANFTNGIFGGMPVGGAISRTSVNSESGVKSPLSGIFTTFIVLLGLYKLTGALFWIPEATLAAVIIVAVINIIPPMSVFIKYWKTSFADFLASFLTLQLTLIASAEQGLGFGVFFMVLYTIIRTVFAHARPVTRADLENQYGADLPSSNESNHIPSGTQVMAFNQAIIFLNAYRVKQDIIDTVQTYHSGIPESGETKEISWSDLETKHIAFLRRRAQFKLPTKLIPRIRVLILDFSRVAFIDTTGLQMLMDLRTEILAYGGEEVEFRFVGLSREVKKKFKRVGWELANSADMQKGFADKGMDTVYELLRPAIEAPRMVRDSGLDFGFGNNLMTGWNNDEGNKVEDRVIVTQITMRDGKAYKE